MQELGFPRSAWCGGAAPAAFAAPADRAVTACMIERLFVREFRSIEAIVDFVNGFLAAQGLDQDQAYDVHLIIEELFTNRVKYSRESTADIELGLHFVQRVADGLDYAWAGRTSTITVTKKLES